VDKLKLFVVGESSPTPEHWEGKVALVIATDAEEAKAIGGPCCGGPATEIPMTEPMLVCYSETGHGED
jgi:hypothetical protein